jgi:hypothetical protein
VLPWLQEWSLHAVSDSHAEETDSEVDVALEDPSVTVAIEVRHKERDWRSGLRSVIQALRLPSLSLLETEHSFHLW